VSRRFSAIGADVRAKHSLHREGRVRVALEIRIRIAAHEDVAVVADADLRAAAARGISRVFSLGFTEAPVHALAEKVLAQTHLLGDALARNEHVEIVSAADRTCRHSIEEWQSPRL